MLGFNKIKFIFLGFYSFFVCNSVFAQTKTYVPLVSDGPFKQIAESANLNEFLLTLYNFGVGVAVSLSILFIILGGIQYMTTDAVGKMEEGKKRMLDAVVGLLIALSSWLIINQINPKIFETDLGLISLKATDKTTVILGGGNPPGGNQPGGGQGNPPTKNPPGASGESPAVIGGESTIRSSLANQGVTVNKSPCTYPGQRNCTNVAGFRQSTVDAITNLNSAIGGKGFVITGGTEAGHAPGTYSHGAGYKFDVGQGSNSANWSKIDGHMKSLIGSQDITPNKTYPVTLSPSGRRLDLRWEGSHWDIKALP
jgi:hypothetical protein